MSRNGRAEPEFEPGAVRIVEDLNMTVDDVSALGFRIIEHWSCVPGVSERDAHALSRRQALIAQQREVERRRRDLEREEKMRAEFAALISRGVPAPGPGMTAAEVMIAVGEGERPPSVFTELLEEQFAAGRGS